MCTEFIKDVIVKGKALLQDINLYNVPGVLLEDVLFQSLNHPLIGMFMAQTAEKLARKYGVTREDSDQFAYESQTRGSAAIEKGGTSDKQRRRDCLPY